MNMMAVCGWKSRRRSGGSLGDSLAMRPKVDSRPTTGDPSIVTRRSLAVNVGGGRSALGCACCNASRTFHCRHIFLELPLLLPHFSIWRQPAYNTLLTHHTFTGQSFNMVRTNLPRSHTAIDPTNRPTPIGHRFSQAPGARRRRLPQHLAQGWHSPGRGRRQHRDRQQLHRRGFPRRPQ